ncbi:MAG: DUF2169 domain-containing protein [Planctomycetota bacterium]|nr:DUF2169 domain-containing protein [Planctomycetota bacterium]
MNFRNYTPFPPLLFESRDEKRSDFGVVVLRGTFEIVPGKRIRLIQQQEPLVMADEYFGEPGKSSLKRESSLAPYKPKTDVLITSDAHAPGGRPAAEWTAAVEFGQTKKVIRVTGPREWRRGLLGWNLTQPQPVTTVPVRYELAYGVEYREGAANRIYDPNPVGTGFADPKVTEPVRAPQILPADATPLEFGKPVPVEGFGPVAPGWTPRRDLAGTFNAIWEKTRWPDLPEDFSFAFYNTASTGLTLDGFANGTETITLTNLTPRGSLTFSLPRFELAILLRFHDGRLVPAPIRLDTIHIDVPENRCFLTWRGVHPLTPPLRVLEVRMRVPDDVIDQSSAVLEKSLPSRS